MASPAHSSHSRVPASYSQRYRRSSFNGAKQLKAAQAPNRRILLMIGGLALVLLVAVGTILYHFATSK